MRDKKPPVIEGHFKVVGEEAPYEPVIKDWMGLFWFIAIPAGVVLVRWAQIKGWL